MIALHYKKKTWNIPENWNELSANQLRRLSKVLFKKMPKVKGRLIILKILTGMSWWQFFRFPQEELAQLLDLTKFVLSKNTLTKQLVPRWKNLYGPADDLDNLKMKEFVFTELYFSEYADTKDEKALSKLIATLYRPAKRHYDKKADPDGDIRIAFNENLVEKHALKAARMPQTIRRSILIWYTGCREALVSRFDHVFKGNSGEASKYGMWSIMRSVAKNGAFGTFDEVQEQYVYTILMDLDETVTEAEELEKAYKK